MYIPGPHDIPADPKLAGPFSGNAYGMALAAGSPAIDAGTTAGAPLVDFEGRLRDAEPDIGAYEYQHCPPKEDVNGDGEVNVIDVQSVAGAWNQSPPPDYADRNGDGKVDVLDVMQVAGHWGERCEGAGAPAGLPAGRHPMEARPATWPPSRSIPSTVDHGLRRYGRITSPFV